jgi:uncharacterized membrane protein
VIARRLFIASGVLLGFYLVVRGIVELFVIDISNSASYRSDWGGPSLIGVLAVHTGPGLVIAAVGVVWLIRQRRRASSTPKHG